MASKTNTFLRNQSGTALVISLIMMVVITLIALASSYTSIFEIGISGNKRGKTNAFFQADGCINELASFAANFDSSDAIKFIPLVPNTTSVYNNPPSACGSGSIIAFLKESGAPRGGGWGQGTSFSYFRINCTGNDSAGSAAISQMQENVMRLLPVE
jgi:type IV pilus assembly protein PilX